MEVLSNLFQSESDQNHLKTHMRSPLFYRTAIPSLDDLFSKFQRIIRKKSSTQDLLWRPWRSLKIPEDQEDPKDKDQDQDWRRRLEDLEDLEDIHKARNEEEEDSL